MDKLYAAFEGLKLFPPPKAHVVPARNGNNANLIGAAYRCNELLGQA